MARKNKTAKVTLPNKVASKTAKVAIHRLPSGVPSFVTEGHPRATI
jgi:hypothetical protein